MRSKKDVVSLTRDLVGISHIVQKICTLVEQDADPAKILFQTRRVHKALQSVQHALIESENDLCVKEVVQLKSVPSKLARLDAHLALLSRYGR